MDKNDVIAIAEGLRLIEAGVEKIQGIMREKNIRSLQDVAAQLIPLLKADDEAINESIVTHLSR